MLSPIKISDINLITEAQLSWYSLKSLNPNTDYTLQFRLKLNPDAFGWNENPIYITTKVGKNGKPNWTSVNLSQNRYRVTFSALNDQKPLKFRFKNGDEELKFELNYK